LPAHSSQAGLGSALKEAERCFPSAFCKCGLHTQMHLSPSFGASKIPTRVSCFVWDDGRAL
jgi:hypothetical protein